MKHSHFGAKSIDEYAHMSGINHWNSGLKIFFSFVIMVMSISSSNFITPLIIAVTMGIFSIYGGKIKTYEYISLLSIPFAFMMMGALAIAADVKLSEGFSITLSTDGIRKATYISAKAIGAVSAMYMMSLSTPMGEIISVLKNIKVPNIIIELMHLIYRYIFIIADCQIKMKNSAAARMGWKNFKISVKTFGLIGGNLLAVSLCKSSDYYNAIESRCFSGNMKFMRKNNPVKASHLVFFLVYIFLVLLTEALFRHLI